MDRVVAGTLVALIEPHYADGSSGRPAFNVQQMLRIYVLQQWFNVSDLAVKESLYDSAAMRSFVSIDLGRESAPLERPIYVRHLLECYHLGAQLFDEVVRHLKSRGLNGATGTVVDAKVIRAPSWTKNKSGKRDPQMDQTMQGNQWYFAMKAHIGVDSRRQLIHSMVASAANLHEKHALTSLLHGRERRVYGDSAYADQTDVIKSKARPARDFTQRRCRGYQYLNTEGRRKNRNKSKVRSKVERAFLIIKRIFRFDKVRYLGIAKDLHRLQVTCALANVFMARRYLLHRA